MTHNHDPLDPAVNNAYDLHTPWRTGDPSKRGTENGRTLYALSGLEPSDDDVMIGSMDTPLLAAVAVAAHNEVIGIQRNPTTHNNALGKIGSHPSESIAERNRRAHRDGR